MTTIEDEDFIDTFSSSLSSLYNIFSPSEGSALAPYTYKPPHLTSTDDSDSTFNPITIRLPPQSVNSLFSHYQWQSGLRLADEISLGHVKVSGLRVLELGAGSGLPAIMAVKLGALSVCSTPLLTFRYFTNLTFNIKVVLSDYNDQAMIDNMDSNVKSIFPKSSSNMNPNVAVWGHSWGELVDSTTLPSFPAISIASHLITTNRFDLILAADCIWNSEFHLPLLDSLFSLLAHSSKGSIQIVSGFHSGRHTIRSFLLKAAERGFIINGEWFEVKCDDSHEEGGEVDKGREKRIWGWDIFEEKEESIEERNRWVVEGKLIWSKEALRLFERS